MPIILSKLLAPVLLAAWVFVNGMMMSHTVVQDKPQMHVWIGGDSWVIHEPNNPEKSRDIEELFGTDVLQLPFTNEAPESVVIEHVKKIFPKHTVVKKQK